MTARWVVAAATGWIYRTARRVRISTRAAHQGRVHAGRVLPHTPATVVAGPVLRVLLLGHGPAESPGAASGSSFPTYVAQALAARARRRVEVKTLLGAGWDLPQIDQQLWDEQLHWHYAVVVSAAYRPALAEVPLAEWAGYTESLRATLTG